MARKPPAESLYTGTPVPVLEKARRPKPPASTKPYASFCSTTAGIARMLGNLGKGAKFSDDERQAVEFLSMDLTAEALHGASKGLMIYAIILGIVFGVITAINTGALATLEFTMPAAAALLVAGMGFAAGKLLENYPQMQAERERKLAIAYVPEIVNYLVMNMRLSPNLEKAVDFAANHGRGKIAEDFKKLVWDVQLGVYSSVEEGLDAMAYRWGAYNDDFKQALMLIRASVLEGDENRRLELLEKASEDVLEGSKEKMDLYARQLHQPTVYLYYFGILLPLMLAIVLPIASGVMQNLPVTGLLPFLLLYDVALPLLVYVMAQGIIQGRPPTYVPPDVPNDFEGLPPKGTVRLAGVALPYIPLAIIVFITAVAAGSLMDSQVVAAKLADLSSLEPEKLVATIPHVTLPLSAIPGLKDFALYQFAIFGTLIGASLASSLYLYGKYSARKKVQDDIRAMEGEFKDALYVLASRLGENRPIEDALRHAIDFLPKSRVSKRVFKRILENITTLGMTLDSAIFDPTFGAVANVPSEVIRGGMRVMCDSVQLGVNVAATALINMAMQIRNQQKIDEMLKRLLEDVTTMLGTMGTFIAPIVLAVVTTLQRIIIGALTGNCPEKGAEAAAGALSSAGSAASGLGGGAGMSQMFCNIDPAKVVSPGEFTLVMGIYVIEIVVLLAYFNSQVEDTHNNLAAWMRVAYSLPVAITVFCVTAYFAGSFLGAVG